MSLVYLLYQYKVQMLTGEGGVMLVAFVPVNKAWEKARQDIFPYSKEVWFTRCVSSYSYICVLMLLDVCPRTPIYVSSYKERCVLVLLDLCPHTPIYVSSYCYVCVLIL